MFNSDEMEIVRKQTITRLAESMASGEISMPRTSFDLRNALRIEIDNSAPNMFTENYISATSGFRTQGQIYYVNSENMSRTEVNSFPRYADAVGELVTRATDKSESIILLAISEAQTLLIERLKMFPLFLVAVPKNEAPKYCDWLRDHTDLHEGLIADIYGTAEYSVDPAFAFYHIRNDETAMKVTPISNTNYTHELAHTYSLTEILKFCVSQKREHIPTQESILAYHKHASLVNRYSK